MEHSFNIVSNYRKYIMAALFVFVSLNSFGQELTVYVIPPKRSVSWNSPSSLFVSYVRSILKNDPYDEYSHSMGHIVVELKDSTRYIIAGMVGGDNARMKNKVLFKGYGLGIFFTAVDGKLQEGQRNTTDINMRYGAGDVAYMRFPVSDSMFARLWQYMSEYKERGYDKIYNGENKPREGKGAGCSAFGTSFIEIGDLLPSTELAKWQVHIKVPERLLGGAEYGGKWVGIEKVLFSSKWARADKEKYRMVSYYEPSLMFRWINEVWEESACNTSMYGAELRGQTKGLVVDRRDYPVPQEPIWQTPVPPITTASR